MSQNNSPNIKRYAVVPLALVLLGFSTLSQGQLFFPDRQEALIERGRLIFFNETFNGNGRTCGTCHRAENNVTIDPAFIATLPDTDPLFVAEFNPDLQENFENPRLMREFALILENQDGFNVLRATSTCVASHTCSPSPHRSTATSVRVRVGPVTARPRMAHCAHLPSARLNNTLPRP